MKMRIKIILFLAAIGEELVASTGTSTKCFSTDDRTTDKWCTDNCLHTPPYCPQNMCKCEETATTEPLPTEGINANAGCLAVETTYVTKNETKFSSPGYLGRGYKDNQKYCWKFKAKKEDDKLSISITTIMTEYGYDIVTIYESDESGNKERVLLSTSGDIPPGNIISNKNEIKILFNTDDNKNMKGFEASVMAVKKKDLPHFAWEEFWKGKIGIKFQKDSSNPIHEVIEVKLAPHYEESCIFIGSTKNTNLTISSPYSSKNCQSLGQHAQISVSSVFLTQRRDGQSKRATFAIKNGILQETTEDFFIDNTFDKNVDNRLKRELRQQQIPSHIEIRINLAYDRSILDKFKNFGSKDVEIKKQLRQLFYFAKSHLEELSGNTKIEILLKENIILIDETLRVNDSSLQYIRKFQTNFNEPLIVVCGDFDEFNIDNKEEDYVNGLSYRSGACRPDSERYGVALVAWREDLAFTGDVFAHEIEHMFGMTHHGHTHHDLSNWYSKQGFRCYKETCPSPPSRDNGDWCCTENNKECRLKCSPGFATVASIIHCENGQFSRNVGTIGCSPSVFLIMEESSNNNHMEVYHPTDDTGRNISCSNIPPPPAVHWYAHGSVLYEGVLISCGAAKLCSSLNLEAEDPQWKLHQIPYMPSTLAVVSGSILYLFSRSTGKLIHTTLPLQEIPQFTYDDNREYNGHDPNPLWSYGLLDRCITQIDEDRVALMGGYVSGTGELSNVTIYNLKQKTSTNLSPMITPRRQHACIKVDIDGKPWLVVSGGNNENLLTKTERLNLEGSNNWEAMEDLNEGRRYHQMVWTAKDTIIALGGKSNSKHFHGEYKTKSIEVLNWNTKTWKLQEESLAKSYEYSNFVEISASLLGCQINDATVCPELPQIKNGTWSCNTAKNKWVIHCDIGYVSLFKQTTCFGGAWSNVNKIQCEPSVWLASHHYTHSFYHPNIGNLTCSKPPPHTFFSFEDHTMFTYKNHLYICGGRSSVSSCESLDLENDEFQWKRHTMNHPRQRHSFVTLENKLYFIGYTYTYLEPMLTTLPLAEETNFIPVPNLTHAPNIANYQRNCVVKLNEHSFITIWMDGLVSKYDAIQQTETQLAQLSPPRYGHACLMVTESGKEWIVVSGGSSWCENKNNYILTTERLDLSTDAASWENMEAPLNAPRLDHKMIMTDRGIMAIGGRGDNTVEVLNWTTKTWSVVEPSLPNGIDWISNSMVEVPASTFGCQALAIDITGCEGEYDYNQEYTGGNVKQLGNRETCHSVCEKEEDCMAWTWNSGDRECRLQTSVGITQFKSGSVSGLQGSCKPKCFLLLKNPSTPVSKHLCDNKAEVTGPEEECQPMIQMVPDELREDNTNFICYEVEGKSLCEEIAYSDVDLLCNDEPSIVTLQTKQRINKHPYVTHQTCYLTCKRYE